MGEKEGEVMQTHRTAGCRDKPEPRALVLLVLLLAGTGLSALDFDLGIGVLLDVAPFGIESAQVMINAALWLGERRDFQAGLSLSQGFSPGRNDTSLALCGRYWLIESRLAAFGGGGLRLTDFDDHVITPLFLGGLRVEAGPVALLPVIALRIKPDDPDWEAWCLAQWVLR
jgi:hypothetical protein